MCMIIVVQFLLGMMVVSWEIENKTYAKFWGRNFILGKVKVADSPQKHSQKSLGTLTQSFLLFVSKVADGACQS